MFISTTCIRGRIEMVKKKACWLDQSCIISISVSSLTYSVEKQVLVRLVSWVSVHTNKDMDFYRQFTLYILNDWQCIIDFSRAWVCLSYSLSPTPFPPSCTVRSRYLFWEYNMYYSAPKPVGCELWVSVSVLFPAISATCIDIQG